jgi:hypothetical protein
MLIHVTRFVSVQEAVHSQVSAYLSNIQRRLQYGDGKREQTIMDEFQDLWDSDFEPTSQDILFGGNDIDWQVVKECIRASALAIGSVRLINGTAGDILDYIENRESGLSVIAIGGDKLSRGLTLEGLTVSYFLRTSHMYDTLMQMGRWFGYRPGYKDVCRLFLPPDLQEWFRHITLASEELRQEFAHMVSIGGKPSDYGLKVRSHPTLLVTAPVKMRQGTELDISFSGSICETIMFHKNATFISNNEKAVLGLLDRITSIKQPIKNPSRTLYSGETKNWSGLYWENVIAGEIIRFLREYQTHEESRRVNSQLLAEYIERQTMKSTSELSTWTVFLASSSQSEKSIKMPPSITDKTFTVFRDWQRNNKPEENKPQSSYRIGRLLSPIDEGIDINNDEWGYAMEFTRTAWQLNSKPTKSEVPPKDPAGWAFRQARKKDYGLLLIYPLEPNSDKSDLGSEGPPIYGIGLSFPGNLDDEKVTYVVNTVYQDQEYEDME